MVISKEFRFEAAHYLPNLPEHHKCRRLHGHSFRFEVVIEGRIDPRKKWVLDYGEISKIVKPIVEEYLDHRLLNEVEGLENPTSEQIAIWLWEKIKPKLSNLKQIVVYETCTTKAIYTGEL
ncbi:MAG: 6-carboxytetrahydropterin synthase QueD [Leptonema sp. (in: bacteria)]